MSGKARLPDLVDRRHYWDKAFPPEERKEVIRGFARRELSREQ